MLNSITKKILILFIFCAGIAGAQVKIASYNLLNYPGSDASIRNPLFRTTISSMNPDILVVQEITSQAGVNGFLSYVMNYGGNVYSAGTFIDGPDTDNAIFYRTSVFIFLGNTPIKTALRDINEFKLVHITTQDTLRIYSVHLKASTGTANELSRAAEVDSLRKATNNLPNGSNFIVCGDFNIYGSNEPAYQKLLETTSGNNGKFNDALNMSGTWNNSIYKAHHTQSTRVRSFGGGATGGLDDRFDLMLYSDAVKYPGGITYVINSLTPYGNDGNHFNDSINRMPNTAVTQEVANALHYSSDHLPVYSLFAFETQVSITPVNSELPKEYKLHQNYPNPFNPVTRFRFDIPRSTYVEIEVYALSGRVVSRLINEYMKAGTYEMPFNAENLTSGIYFYRIKAGEFTETKKMMLVK